MSNFLHSICDKVSLHSPGTNYVDQASLEHMEICLPEILRPRIKGVHHHYHHSLTLLLMVVLEVLARVVRQEKKITGTQIDII